MPETLPGATSAILLLAVLTAGCALGVRRWGTGPAPDPVAEALRRVPSWQAMLRLASEAWAAVTARVDALRPPAFEPSWGPAAVMFAEEGGDERRGFFKRRRERTLEPQVTEPPAGPQPEPPPAAVAEPEPALPPEPPAPPRPPRPRADHVDLAPEKSATDESGEPEARFRVRLRRGLRKTRDYLNRDVREVFGPGPVPEAFDALEEVLIRSDVGVATASALADELRDRGRELTSDTLPAALRDEMRKALGDADRRLRVNADGLSVWLVVGVNGTGKTTSVVKLAHHAASKGFKVCVAAADTFRAAAIEQLERWGERLDLDIVRQHAGADPAAVVFDAIAHARARGYDLVIADTAGRLHTRSPLMEELRKVRRVVDKEDGLLTEALLVLDATTGQNGIAQARSFAEAVDVTGVVLAKLDGTAKGGIVIAVERELGIPVKAVGLGEKADDLAPFDPDSFVEALFSEE